MAGDLLVYGSYGYTGSLIARTALDRGLAPVLAGRRADPLERQAIDLGCDHRVFSLQHHDVVERRVADVDAVLNCAGPFTRTAAPMVQACLRAGTDYLDVAGTVDVLEAAAERDRDAEKAGVTVLPAVGFDVVPTDCLAAHLARQVDAPTRLALALDGLGTYSPGTVKSIVEGLDRPGAVREDGAIRTVPVAYRTRRLDFGEGPRPAVTVPWGDVATAYYTTGIPNVEVYATVPSYAVGPLRWSRPLVGLLAADPVQRALQRVVDLAVPGPTPDERARNAVRVWGAVVGAGGDVAAARMRTPDPYDVTAGTAVEAARRVLAGDVSPGFQTPASAFGPEFATAFEGIEREPVETAGPVPESPGA